MEDYTRLRYIYPPRPEQKVSSSALDTYDNGMYVGEPKLNGSCCTIFIKGDELRQFGRTSLLSLKKENGTFLSSSGSTGTPVCIYFSKK
jgi:hypothetical protein